MPLKDDLGIFQPVSTTPMKDDLGILEPSQPRLGGAMKYEYDPFEALGGGVPDLTGVGNAVKSVVESPHDEFVKGFARTVHNTLAGLGGMIEYGGEYANQYGKKMVGKKQPMDDIFTPTLDYKETAPATYTESPTNEAVRLGGRASREYWQGIAEDYKPRVESFTDIKSISDGIDYISSGIGNLAGSMALTSIMPGVYKPTEMAGVVVKEGVKRGLGSRVLNFLKPNPMDVPIGLMEGGEIVNKQLEQHEKTGADLSLSRLIATAVPATLIERGLGVEALAAKMGRMGPEARNFAKKNLVPRILQGLGITGLEEGAEEFVQTYLENYGGDPKSVWTKEALYDALNAGLQGMIGGHIIGGTGGAAARKQYNDVQEQQKVQQGILVNPIDMNHPAAPKMIEHRANVARYLEDYIGEQDPELAHTWREYAAQKIGSNEPIDLSMLAGTGRFDVTDYGSGNAPQPTDTNAENPPQGPAPTGGAPVGEVINPAPFVMTPDQVIRQKADEIVGKVEEELHNGAYSTDDLEALHQNYVEALGEDHPVTTGISGLMQKYSNPIAQGILTANILNNQTPTGEGVIDDGRQMQTEGAEIGTEAQDTGEGIINDIANQPIAPSPESAITKAYPQEAGETRKEPPPRHQMPSDPAVYEAFQRAVADPSEENMEALVAHARRFDYWERDQKGRKKRNTGFQLFKDALGEIPGFSYPEWKALGAQNATDFWNSVRNVPGVKPLVEPLTGDEFPTEDEFDKVIETGYNNIQGIKEELYEEGYTQSEIQDFIEILVEKHQNDIAGREFEERLAELKEIARAERLPEVLRLLHATPEDFQSLQDEFIREDGSHGTGHYFGDSLDYIEQFGESKGQHTGKGYRVIEADLKPMGKKLFDLDTPLSPFSHKKIEDGLKARGTSLQQVIADVNASVPASILADQPEGSEYLGANVLIALENRLGSKEAANFLHEIGFVGNVYGNELGSKNYAIYTAEDLDEIRTVLDRRKTAEPEAVDTAAHEAATSPQNDLAEPSQAQKEAGNYKKGHVDIQGLDISIENPKGSVRSGVSRDGKTWETEMKAHYGYIRGTKGKDKDHIDVFIGEDPHSEQVFVVNQVDPSTGKFDEHKVMIGYHSTEEAKAGYLANYEPGWQGMGDVNPMTMDEFKTWLKEDDTTKPAPAGELFDTGGMFTLSGNQPYAPKEMKAPEKRGGDRLVDVEKQTTDELRDRLSGEKAKREYEEEKANEETPAEHGADNKIFTKERADKAREILRKKLSQMNVGIDPEMLAAGIDLAGYYIEGGARKFVDFSKKMVEDLGDKIRPYLKSFYLAVRNYPGMDKTGMETEQDLENYKEEEQPAPEKKTAAAVPLEDVERVYIERQLAGRKPAKDLGENQNVVLTGGPPASGKSTTLEADLEDKDKYVVVNADDVRRLAGKETDTEYHEEASRIANVLLKKALSEGYHVIYDSQLTNLGKADGIIRQVLESGGTAEVFLLECEDPWATKIRTVTRYLVDDKKGSKKPRFVPDEAIIKGYEYSLPTFIELFERYRDNAAVGFKLVDNSVNMRDPIPVFEKGVGGIYKVYDKQLFDKLMSEGYNIYDEGKTAKARKSRPRFTASTLSSGWEEAYDAISTIAKEKHGVEISTGEIQSFQRSYAPDNRAQSGRQLEEQTPAAQENRDPLKDLGLSVTYTVTNRGNPVWQVSGNTKPYVDAMKAAKLRWYGPKKVWSHFGKDDPTDRLIKALEDKGYLQAAQEAPAAAHTETYREVDKTPGDDRLNTGGNENATTGAAAEKAAEITDDRRGHEGESPEDVQGAEEIRAAEEDGRTEGTGDDAELRSRVGEQDTRGEPERIDPSGSDAELDNDREPSLGGNARDLSGVSGSRRDYRIAQGELTRQGSWLDAAINNLKAIELVKKLAEENRQATQEEQAVLLKYVGWGASEVAQKMFPGYAERARVEPTWAIAPWRAQVEKLVSLLDENETKTAARSTQYAHYTSEEVIRGIYKALGRFGFQGGRILDPGMGTGHFAGLLPSTMKAASSYTGVEMDHITAAIARQLYQRQNIIEGDYTKTTLPNDYYDVAIGNPPFASTVILADPDYAKYRFKLHDYFFAKTIDKVRPGGLLVFVTSRYTMDKQESKARDYIMKRADLLGAVRLPQTAFKENAGTEVVTDIIFLRKKVDGVESQGEAWKTTASVKTREGEDTIVNEYYANHPEMVLGEHSMTGKMYAKNTYTVQPREDRTIGDQLTEAIERLPENTYSSLRQAKEDLEKAVIERDYSPKIRKEGGLYLSDTGELKVVDHGSGVPISSVNSKLSAKDVAWLKEYVKLRDALKQNQYDQLNEGPWEKSLKDLNRVYDAFVKKHGHIREFTVIHRKRVDEDGVEHTVEEKRFKNDRLLRQDTEGALVAALERVNNNGTISKSPFLLERTIKRPEAPEIKTVHDALAVVLNDKGRLDLDAIAQTMNLTKEDVITELGDLIFEEPGKEGYILADEYLSGNVVKKLREAKEAAKTDERFERNIPALEKVQPLPLTSKDITVMLGASWIPLEYYNDFRREVLGITGDYFEIKYSPVDNHWTVGPRRVQTLRREGEWGTEDRGPNEILDAILNNATIKITRTYRDEFGTNRTVPDVEATAGINEIIKKMRDRFASWIWQDPARARDVVQTYNDRFNTLAGRRFDGSHLTLPGVSLKFKLHAHQKRAIWRIIQTGNTYLGHAVGAGKTIEMVAAGMEMKRLGFIDKPMYVVPNHMLGQFASEFQELYPLARIMVADEMNFHTDNRRRFVAQAALNGPDAIVMTHSAFQLLRVKEENINPVREAILQEMRDALDELEADKQTNRIRIKRMEQRIEQTEQRFDKMTAVKGKDDVVTFEDMAVDFLFVDEAHMFRKLDFTTNRQAKGIDPVGSVRAMDLYIKSLWLDREKPGRSHVFASGTPVTNTMGELYTIMRFFIPDEMVSLDINHFDGWANTFGITVTNPEMNAAGNYELVERFSSFVNVPELMSRVRLFMDVLTSSQLGDFVKRPDIEGGKPEVVVTPPSDRLKDYQKNVLQPRIETSRKWKPSPGQKGNPDPLINIITDGRLAGIDMRFVNPLSSNDPGSKLNQFIDGIIDSYRATTNNTYLDDSGSPAAVKGGSIIAFYNVGFGEMVAKRRGFNAREWFMKRMKEAGIPADQVVWIDDHNTPSKKEAVFNEIRQGKKRILIGSAKKMGTGVNVQTRLAALHYLDPPWYPADVEQPLGRIIRQGNQNEIVVIRWYATKGSYDATQWGMVSRKSRTIEQAFMGDADVRKIDDISESSQYEMASALAAGDERVIRLVALKTEADRLNLLKGDHSRKQYMLGAEIRELESNLGWEKKKVAKLKKAIEAVGKSFVDDITGKCGKLKTTDREEFGKAIMEKSEALEADEKIKAKIKKGEKHEEGIGTINGFPVSFYKSQFATRVYLNLTDDIAFAIVDSSRTDTPKTYKGVVDRMVHKMNGLDRELQQATDQAEDYERRLKNAQKQLGAPFEHEQELAEKIAEVATLEAELTAEEANKTPAPDDNVVTKRGELPSVPYPDKPKYGVNTVKAFLQPLIRKLDNVGRVEVVKNYTALPIDVARRAGLMAMTEDEEIFGMYDPITDTTYIFADAVAGQKEAQTILIHEIIGHRGVMQVLSPAERIQVYQTLIKEFKDTPELERIIKDYDLDLTNEEDRDTASKELIAHLAEKQGKPTVWSKIVAIVKRALARLGFKNFEETEIERLIRKSWEYSKGQRKAGQADDVIAKRERRPTAPFFSQLLRTVQGKLTDMPGKAQSIIPWLQKQGVKPMELEEMGVSEWLKRNQTDGKVDKAAFAEWVKGNQIQVQEVMKGKGQHIEDLNLLAQDMFGRDYDELNEDARRDVDTEWGIEGTQMEAEGRQGTKFGQYVLPGGSNYREILFTLPLKDISFTAEENEEYRGLVPKAHDNTLTDAERKRYFELYDKLESMNRDEAYHSSHWSEPNVLAHVRMQDFTDKNGKKVLLVEEVQSDWHQTGKKEGYAGAPMEYNYEVVPNPKKEGTFLVQLNGETITSDDLRRDDVVFISREHADNYVTLMKGRPPLADLRVPNAPLKQNWHEYAMKRMIRYAAENGYDAIAWTPGEQQAERYDLSKQISKIMLDNNEHGDNYLMAYDLSGKQVIRQKANSQGEVADLIGKEAADRLWNSEPVKGSGSFKNYTWKELSGLDLKVGGKGMKVFYDQLVPGFMNKYVKQWGAKVGETAINSNKGGESRYLYDEEGNRRENPNYTLSVPSIPVTPAMREAVLYEGQPLYRKEKALNWSMTAGRLLSSGVRGANQDSNRTILTERDFVKPEDKPVFRKASKSAAAVGKLRSEIRADMAALKDVTGSPVWEELLKSPEWYDHPQISKLVNLFTEERSRLYNETFYDLTEGDQDVSIIDELANLKKKGMSLTDRLRGRVSVEYMQLEDLLDEGDAKKIPPHKMEKLMEDRQIAPEVVSAWKRVRGSFDKALDRMLEQMREIIEDLELKGGKLPVAFKFDEKSTDNVGKWTLIPPKEFESFFIATPKTAPKYGLRSVGGVNYVMGKKKEDGSLAVQAIHFKKANFTEEAAKRWWNTHSHEFFCSKDSQVQSTYKALQWAVASLNEWRGSYAPRTRPVGDWMIRGKRGQGEDTEVFRTHGSHRDLLKLQREMREEGWTTQIEKLERLPETVYQNVRLVEAANLIDQALGNMGGEMSGKFHDELVGSVADVVRARGYRNTMIKRGKKHITGYITDPMERYIRYVSSISGGLSKSEIARKATDVFGQIDPVKDRRRHDFAQKYMAEQLRNMERGDRLLGLAKSIATVKYLGFNPRSMLVNLTALATTVPAAIHQYGLEGKVGMARIGVELTKASADYAKHMLGKKLTGGDQAFVEYLKKEGYDDPQYTRDAMGHIQGAYGKAWNKVMSAAMILFKLSEQYNRGTTMLATYRLAKKQGLNEDQARERAKLASDRAHGVYGKGTLPSWALGTGVSERVGQLLYTYGKFGHNYIQMCYDLGFKKRNIAAFAWAMASPLAIGGGMVLPFRKELAALVGAILRALGIDTDPEKWWWDKVRKWFGKKGEQVGRHGLMGLIGVDISGSLSIGVGVPKGLMELAGPAGGLITDIAEGVHLMRAGQKGLGVAKAVLPTGLERPFRAYEENRRGYLSGKARRMFTSEGPYKLTPVETAERALGFRPARMATELERQTESKRVEQRFTDRREGIYERVRNAAAERGDMSAILKDVTKYNLDVAKSGMAGVVPYIKRDQIAKQQKSLYFPSKKEKRRVMER